MWRIVLIYQNQRGNIKPDVQLLADSVRFTQTQMSQLFTKAVSTSNGHIENIYAEKELSENDTLRKFGQSEFSTKTTNFYNLDVIICIGYRVKSQQGTQCRLWEIQRLNDDVPEIEKSLINDFSQNKRLSTTGKTNAAG